jgi:hypothetical protein
VVVMARLTLLGLRLEKEGTIDDDLLTPAKS